MSVATEVIITVVRSRTRLLGLALLVLLVWGTALAGPALAVEGEGGPPEVHERPDLEEVGTQSETAREFFPDPYEAPSVYQYFIWPLLLIGGVVVLLVLILYLVWQPAFADERRKRREKRRR